MSKKLLDKLAGPSKGEFRQFIDSFNSEPRIAWYPSAGEDLRDLLFLHPDYSKKKPATQLEPPAPDLFLHTDYFPGKEQKFLDSPIVYSDDRTTMTITTIEELTRINLPLDPGIVDFPNGSIVTGRVVFLNIDVKSNLFGEYSRSLVYAFVENAAFCSRIVFPNKGKFSHVIHVRYGGGCGGGRKINGFLDTGHSSKTFV